MQDRPLDRAERDLLAVLADLHASCGPVARETLSVETRGRGMEFGRALGRLKRLGLIDETLRRPFFLRRLLGARTVLLLQPTSAGLAVLVEARAPAPAVRDAAVEIAPEITADAAAEIGAMASAPAAGVAEASGAAGDSTVAQPAEDGVLRGTAAPLAEAVAEREVLDPVLTEVAPVLPSPVPSAAAPSAPGRPASVAAGPAKAKRRVPVLGFAEDLGGVPMDDALVPAALALAPEVVAALTDILSDLGMELTFAGQALAAQRMAGGATAGEALSQVVLYAFAHAARHNVLSGQAVEAPGLADYATEVLRELERLRMAGEIGQAAHDNDRDRILTLVRDPDRCVALMADLLADPFGGAAPPAVLPDELRPGAADADRDQ